ncbi:potassium voltage-gated channel subfamily A member 1-like [Haliotis rufescens]|uniref:potassium voltage-gated channel subfamily A member 1-like n=1 Tax=Haliotis rufescens TaxID=6454 RepID=UPI001EB0392E|nr:potassium voltage-gated channel subfamily A member 1-like [Haliotis rufescens]
MAVVSMFNQAPYRRAHSSRERLNVDNDGGDLWISQSGERHNNNHSLEYKLRSKGGASSRCGPHLASNHTCNIKTCDRISINVSGQYFETWRGTLEKHPSTLLGDPRKRQKFYDKRRNEYFFDRHRPAFEAIFNYYQYGGRLNRPEPVPDDIFLTELEFFEIEKDMIDEYRREEGYMTEKIVLPERGWQRKIWMVMEYPETSCIAYAVAIISVVITLLSIVLFCVETLPVFSTNHCSAEGNPNFLDPFFVLESICTAWFTVEVLIRIVVCPNKPQFFKDFKNLVDCTAIIPYYVTLSNVLTSMSCEDAKSSSSLSFLRVIRLVRVFKLTKHSAGLQVLILTFRASLQGLCLFLVAIVVCILLFSSAIYFAEMGIEGSHIHSIPDGFWWAIITMTTVGYGDKYPLGPVGKIIGSICALAGVLTLAIPVPIITENFNKFYAHKTGRGRV